MLIAGVRKSFETAFDGQLVSANYAEPTCETEIAGKWRRRLSKLRSVVK